MMFSLWDRSWWMVSSGSVVGDGDRDVDVAPRGVRVGAHLVGGVGESLSLVVREVGDDDLELHGEAESALAVRADLHAGADRRIVDLHLLCAGDRLQGGVEAR